MATATEAGNFAVTGAHMLDAGAVLINGYRISGQALAYQAARRRRAKIVLPRT